MNDRDENEKRDKEIANELELAMQKLDTVPAPEFNVHTLPPLSAATFIRLASRGIRAERLLEEAYVALAMNTYTPESEMWKLMVRIGEFLHPVQVEEDDE